MRRGPIRPNVARALLFRGLAGVVLWVAACSGTELPDENFRPFMVPEAEPGLDAGDGSDAGRSDAEGLDAESTDAESPDAARPTTDLASLFEGCGAAPASTAEFSRRRLRREALACTHYHLCGFQAAAEALNEAVAAYADAPEDANLMAAREAYRTAMQIWSRVEVMQYGPLASSSVAAGKDVYQGEGLRDQVYSWPLVSRCRVDEQVIERDDLDEGLEPQLVTSKGLFALEYLLFAPETETACAEGSETADAFNALGEAQRRERKQQYAAAVAKEIARLSENFVDAYEPEGDFAQAFIEASDYPNAQEALNVLGWALIYIERELKDWKLGTLLDITISSPVSEAESTLSGVSTLLVEQNLLGFARIFEGCREDGTGIGFDDWLVAADHTDLAEDLLAQHANTLTAVRALPADLADARNAELMAAYNALRALTTLMKSELFGDQSPLNLALPMSVEGDTD